MKFDADLSPSTGYILSQNIVVKCKTWESILLTQLTLEYVNVLTLSILGGLVETGAGQPMLYAISLCQAQV